MLKFKLCYRLPGTDDIFIAPQLLTENQPDYVWDGADNLQLRFAYDFMPKGILTRFIVDMHQEIATDQEGRQLVWKSGVILEYKDTRAEVIEDYDRRMIYVRIAGRWKRDLMTIVKRNLDRLHRSFHDLRCHVLIPCNCDLCRAGENEPHFFRLEMLERAIDAGAQPTCDQSFKSVDPRTLILDVFEGQPPQDMEPDILQKHFHLHVGGNVGRGIKIAGGDLTEIDRETAEDED
jgi:internalin A